jgi:hypothetical protein
MTERQGIEIDYCPQCRGVWLDRGELDKIIDRAAGDSYKEAAPREGGREDTREGAPSQWAATAPEMPRPVPRVEPPRVEPRYGDDYKPRRDWDDDDDDDYRRGGYKRKKRKGLLGELFDFD